MNDLVVRRRLIVRSAAVLLPAGLLLIPALTASATGDARDDPPAGAKSEVSAAQEAEDLTDGLSSEDLAAALVGSGVTVVNAEYIGDDAAAGVVSGFGDVFGIDEGIALSSGAIAGEASNLFGPNERISWSTDFDRPGYALLDELVDPLVTHDASVLEIDFVPDTDQIDFRYVFGSEEYNEFVNSDYNDVFAFFVNGENCAVVGDDADPVSVNTINNDVNAEFYIDNEHDWNTFDPTPHNTELDGFTTVLTCAATVEAGETNTLILAIADTNDRIYDSTVLIEAGSFRSNSRPVADDQAVSTAIDTAVDITLTGSDPDGDPITFVVESQPSNGELTGSAPELVYTPEDGYSGADEFTFTVSDGSLTSEPATVTITIGEPDPTPEPTESPEPTDSPEPTESPEPTDSPQPTGSPEPTDSPEPTTDPTPTTPPGDDELPDTGFGTAGWLGIAALMAVAGMALAGVARGRVHSRF
ncbi:choice-of-anchor L domain-containing protein [Phytoactinopolyspora limicola]|uniref:choice-of-anchor L domain-containing protein n=1 Tax=Phytoactinopolyspora limicola TaxID=2715536 RepID=UPI00140ABBDE|nr:choice-of-anchor L domain-containing protein [Phytoactinopolyspora limicola]